jgi:hypothetical protein
LVVHPVLGLESGQKGSTYADPGQPVSIGGGGSPLLTDTAAPYQGVHVVGEGLHRDPAEDLSAPDFSLASELTRNSSYDGGRHCATVVCESGGDFGTFTISYDAPSPRLHRETQSLPRDDVVERQVCDTPPAADVKSDNTSSPIAAAVKQRSLTSKAEVSTSANSNLETVSDRRKKVRPVTKGEEGGRKSLSSIPVARSVGDVSRLPKGGETGARVTKRSSGGRKTPPPTLQSTWSCWRRDVDMSDAGSETESACSTGRKTERRRDAPRSAPVMTARTNRTFALRCAAKQREDSRTSPAATQAVSQPVTNKPSRSRSAENNAR